MKTKNRNIGICTGKIADTRTGAWRSQRPVVDKALCVNCGMCMMYCPTGVISEQNECAEIDYTYCKGCGVCVTVCPKKALAMRKEEALTCQS